MCSVYKFKKKEKKNKSKNIPIKYSDVVRIYFILCFIFPFSGESFDYFMNFFGKCFVRFFTNFGYDKMLKATGRYFCDFLQSVDNIHLQMRFTYPKMKSPSMQLTQTDENGAILVYRSGRSGFSRFVLYSFLLLFFHFYESNFVPFPCR